MENIPANDVLVEDSPSFILWDVSLDRNEKDMLMHHSCRENSLYSQFAIGRDSPFLSSNIAVIHRNADL